VNLQALCWSFDHAIRALGSGEPVKTDTAIRNLEALLSTASPAIYEIEGSYLVVLRGGKNLRVLAPDLSEHKVKLETAASAIRAPFEAPYLAGYQSISSSKKVISALLREQTGAMRFNGCWTFPAASTKPGIGQLIAAHTAQYLLWLTSWGLLGTLTFSGHLDRGWLIAWALLLMTLVPFRLLTTWTQGRFAIGLGRMVKQRLLEGALRLTPEEVKTGGLGTFLGQALEAEALETLAISGGLAGLLALVEMIPAMFILGRFAIALALWCGIALFAAWRFFQTYKSWTGKRMDLTNHLVESMVGNRTRLAQQPRADWHTDEDSSLSLYRGLSAHVDQTGSWLVAAVPRGWLLLGLVCLAPSIVAGHALSSETAVLLGGVLLGFSAFQRLVASFADVAGAITGWQRIKPLFDAAARPVHDAVLPVQSKTEKLLEADRLTFKYPSQSMAALRGCTLSIRRGDKILLEGTSGSGKTTFASLLAGLRKPDSGLLLINGLDRHTLGEAAWRKQVAVVPQFHENHIITETLAFNLLMSRPWPPSPSDLKEAEAVCQELGLGRLLARMPGGMTQMLGEGGWQLSHGERSRLFLARALLQQSDLVILDESFAALDPDNLQTAMETTLHRAETLLVIAHP